MGANPLDDGEECRLRRFAVHQPREDIGILAAQQATVVFLVRRSERGVLHARERHQHEVQLEHAAPAVPVDALGVDSIRFRHSSCPGSALGYYTQRHSWPIC